MRPGRRGLAPAGGGGRAGGASSLGLRSAAPPPTPRKMKGLDWAVRPSVTPSRPRPAVLPPRPLAGACGLHVAGRRVRPGTGSRRPADEWGRGPLRGAGSRVCGLPGAPKPPRRGRESAHGLPGPPLRTRRPPRQFARPNPRRVPRGQRGSPRSGRGRRWPHRLEPRADGLAAAERTAPVCAVLGHTAPTGLLGRREPPRVTTSPGLGEGEGTVGAGLGPSPRTPARGSNPARGSDPGPRRPAAGPADPTAEDGHHHTLPGRLAGGLAPLFPSQQAGMAKCQSFLKMPQILPRCDPKPALVWAVQGESGDKQSTADP